MIDRVSPLLIKRWMGHAKLETTEVYSAVIGAEERSLARLTWRGAGVSALGTVSSNGSRRQQSIYSVEKRLNTASKSGRLAVNATVSL